MVVYVNMNGFYWLIIYMYIKCNVFILKLVFLSFYIVNIENKDFERYIFYLM